LAGRDGPERENKTTLPPSPGGRIAIFPPHLFGDAAAPSRGRLKFGLDHRVAAKRRPVGPAPAVSTPVAAIDQVGHSAGAIFRGEKSVGRVSTVIAGDR